MTTKVKICSNAALLVGCTPIADLTEDSTQARLILNLFDNVRDDLLRAHPWNFAIKRVTLSPLTTKPNHGFNYEFNAPSDNLRLLGVDSLHIGLGFQFEGRKILSNANTINLRYVFRNEDVSTWSPDFISAVQYELASQIAYPIAKSDSLRQTLEQKAQYKLVIAKSNNAMENPSQRIQSNPLLAARY